MLQLLQFRIADYQSVVEIYDNKIVSVFIEKRFHQGLENFRYVARAHWY